MTSIGVESVDSTWYYEFVPSSSLPVVDLSLSIKSKFLSQKALGLVDRILRRYQTILALGCMIGMILSAPMAYMSAPIARIAGVFVFLLVLPLYLAGFSALRFEMVCLVLRDDSAIFFCVMNILTNVFYGIVLGDIRALATCATLVGWSNVVFIDAILRGIRRFTILTVFALVGAGSWLTCMLLNRIDEPHGTSLWQYKDGNNVYDVSAIDYVVNGSSTFIVLLIKIIYCKRKSMRASTRNSVIECAVLRCRMKLTPCSSQLAILNSVPRTRSRVGSSTCESFKTHLQRLQFVRSGTIYDTRRTVCPILISSPNPFPFASRCFVYVLGFMGFGSLLLSSYYVNMPASKSSDNLRKAQLLDNLGSATTFLAFGCSVGFWLVYIACYQRDLLKNLMSSFDFVFYSAQSITTQLVAASMYDWDRKYCFWLATCWVWMQWILCLDALTPVTKSKLRFRSRYAIPVTFVLSIGMVLILFGIMVVGMNPSRGHAIWTSVVSGRVVTIQVLPFFAARLFTMATWMLRILCRLCKGSDADAIILRGAVRYNNYLSTSCVLSKKRIKSVSAKGSLHRVEPSSQLSSNNTMRQEVSSRQP